MIVYLEGGRLRPDNNLVENVIRLFVMGRKNWQVAGSLDGVRASATFFTLIETAKANFLEPYGCPIDQDIEFSHLSMLSVCIGKILVGGQVMSGVLRTMTQNPGALSPNACCRW